MGRLRDQMAVDLRNASPRALSKIPLRLTEDLPARSPRAGRWEAVDCRDVPWGVFPRGDRASSAPLRLRHRNVIGRKDDTCMGR